MKRWRWDPRHENIRMLGDFESSVRRGNGPYYTAVHDRGDGELSSFLLSGDGYGSSSEAVDWFHVLELPK